MGEKQPVNLQDVVAELVDEPPDRWVNLLAARDLTDEQRREVHNRLLAPGRAATPVLDAGGAARDISQLGQLNDRVGRTARVAELNGLFEKSWRGPRYRVLEELGRGGMGTVYKAEQRSPVKRLVAIKVIKPGFDSAEVVARFEAEREALARMDHPNVARVLDAGEDDLGRPYFVMEYVPGVPITKYADDNRLSIRQRLEVFTQACDGVAHAHTKALIHRDVKASNVLAFTAEDGRPRVKVIDFGVAKALTGDRLTDRTLNTERGQAIGTYEAMSPEQADGSPDIDTRTDVYALGVLLYELLAGVKPFDSDTLAKAADSEIRRIIREVEPPRPSTRLSSLKEEAGARVAAARSVRLDGLAKQLRSELEWIPLKAMRKERDRRYTSPLQMAEDIRDYLAGRPLIAGPNRWDYKLAKWYRRNRAAVALASIGVGLTFASAYLPWRLARMQQAMVVDALFSLAPALAVFFGFLQGSLRLTRLDPTLPRQLLYITIVACIPLIGIPFNGYIAVFLIIGVYVAVLPVVVRLLAQPPMRVAVVHALSLTLSLALYAAFFWYSIRLMDAAMDTWQARKHAAVVRLMPQIRAKLATGLTVDQVARELASDPSIPYEDFDASLEALLRSLADRDRSSPATARLSSVLSRIRLRGEVGARPDDLRMAIDLAAEVGWIPKAASGLDVGTMREAAEFIQSHPDPDDPVLGARAAAIMRAIEGSEKRRVGRSQAGQP